MATSTICEFLENSTIHGLVHISTAKTRKARFAWLVIVVCCFAFAIHEITSALKAWQESPVSTTITTHPITELQFPAVTVCPPRGSNTALNQALEKVKDVNFTETDRQEMLNMSREVFLFDLNWGRFMNSNSEVTDTVDLPDLAWLALHRGETKVTLIGIF